MGKAVITGITGQTASYLAELFLEDGHEVYGVHRRSSTNNTWRINHLINNKRFHLIEGDVTDAASIYSIVNELQPVYYCNTAGQSHVHTSFDQPELTFNVNVNGVIHALEAIRKFSKHTRFYQAGSSEQFGNNYHLSNDLIRVQDESTPMHARSPYGASKIAAYHLVRNYRESYNLHASTIMHFNMESPRRGENFVTRKITKYVASLYNSTSLQESIEYKLKLGNLDAKRDWGYAVDSMRAVISVLNQQEPDDYITSTGETHSIREFLSEAFGYIGIDNWIDYVEIDDSLKRPSELHYLCGDSFKIRNKLGWKPQVTFNELVELMVKSDIGIYNDRLLSV